MASLQEQEWGGGSGEKEEEWWKEERRKFHTQPDYHSHVRGKFQWCWMVALSSLLPPWLRYLEEHLGREDEVDTPTLLPLDLIM